MTDATILYDLLKEIFFILDDGDRRLLGSYNLTVARYYALFHLGEHPGMSLRHLSELMLCDKSNTTRIIQGLAADGLVARSPHETDGRTLRLHLTDEGQQLRARVLAAHAAYNRKRFDCIEQVEQDNLLDGLLKLKEGLRGLLQG
ncbi:MAG: MarR family transcriptional regulator [Chloroflexota bacterium]